MLNSYFNLKFCSSMVAKRIHLFYLCSNKRLKQGCFPAHCILVYIKDTIFLQSIRDHKRSIVFAYAPASILMEIQILHYDKFLTLILHSANAQSYKRTTSWQSILPAHAHILSIKSHGNSLVFSYVEHVP